MDELNLDALEALLRLLRAYHVTEFSQGDLRLTVRPDAPPVEAATERVHLPASVPASQMSKLFRGRVPSFSDFRDAGLVTEE